MFFCVCEYVIANVCTSEEVGEQRRGRPTLIWNNSLQDDLEKTAIKFRMGNSARRPEEMERCC